MMEVDFYGRLPAGQSRQTMVRAVCLTLKKCRRKPQGSLSVAFVSDARMRALNRARRGCNRPTDVLSFTPARMPGPARPGRYWGDIVIAPACVKREAVRSAVPLRQQFLRILVHGALHLLGHDHALKAQAQRMLALQERILKELKI